MWVWLKIGYTPNEIAIFHRDNDQQNHWVQWGTLFSDKPMWQMGVSEKMSYPIAIDVPMLKLHRKCLIKRWLVWGSLKNPSWMPIKNQ